MANKIALILVLLFSIRPIVASTNFPSHWWKSSVSFGQVVPSWEILPDKGTIGRSVVLSKRNELGILSNFAPTPIVFEGKKYASLEGAWQSMKYPEGETDKRYGDDKLPYTREDVEQMVGFEAKKAGSLASALMKKHDVNFVTYAGKKLVYRTKKKGDHYQLIKKMMKAKLDQHKGVRDILISTGKLILLPDHHSKSNYIPPAWKYYDIWMDLRAEL